MRRGVGSFGPGTMDPSILSVGVAWNPQLTGPVGLLTRAVSFFFARRWRLVRACNESQRTTRSALSSIMNELVGFSVVVSRGACQRDAAKRLGHMARAESLASNRTRLVL